MTNPDDLVATNGEALTLTRVSEFDTGRDGVSNVTREFTTVMGIVSQPDERAEQELAGRLEAGAITITVPSDTDIRADRDGGRDRIVRPDADPTAPPEGVRLYTVIDVSDDTHPITGTRKVTVTCNEFGGREDLQNDADTYVDADA